MLKRWYEERPFTFGAVFIFFYMTIPIVDAMFIVPYMTPECNGQITDHQVRMCTNWIRNKETKHVRTNKSGYGRLYRNPSSDEYVREQERAIKDFVGTPSERN